jgi:hypothetical protein
VTISAKLGSLSLLFLIAFVMVLLLAHSLPLAVIFGAISIVVGLKAANQGSKWWLAAPIAVTIIFAFLLYGVLMAGAPSG